MKSASTKRQTHIEQIYRANRDHVYNYIYRLSNDHEQAEDVTQQTFVKLIGDPGLKKVSNIKAYLFTIARNHLYDTWKKKKETLLPDDEIAMAEDVDTANVTEEIAQEQLQRAVESCVLRLTDKYRELMVLRYIEDLSIKEITAVTEYSESDIKVSLLRARQQFDQGLTKHMYLKIARSRQQCIEIDTMLAPYVDRDIPDNELAPFDKHITQCQICSEDAEKMKRTRKLMALIPLAGAPLSLDTSFNDALASTGTEASNTTSNVMMTKVAVSVGVVALIVAGVLLLPDKDSNTSPVGPTQVVQQKKAKPATTTTPTAQPGKPAASSGTVLVTATARLNANLPPVESYWRIFQGNSTHQYNNGTFEKELKTKLDPGQYKILAKIGDAEVERLIQVVAGKPMSLDIVIHAGQMNIALQSPKSIAINASHFHFAIYKSRQDIKKGKHIALKGLKLPVTNFILSPGDYFLEASYIAFGGIKAIRNIKILADKTIDIIMPVEIGVFKPEAIFSGKNLAYDHSTYWSIKKSSVQQNLSPSSSPFSKGEEKPMTPGTYILTTKLGKITQESKLTIRNGQVTTHKLVLRGGIVKAAGWLDNSKNKRNTNIYLQVYDFEKFKLHGKPGVYVQPIAAIRNDMPNASAILPVGKYTIVAKNTIGHKVRITQNFTVNDGDTKFIELVIPKKGE